MAIINRKILFSTVFIFSVFLICLGMRNPYLGGDNGPKQRPRAITENEIKHASEVIEQMNFEVACTQTISYRPPVRRITRLDATRSPASFTLISPADLTARAPPALLL
jgi:hypothetical protein